MGAFKIEKQCCIIQSKMNSEIQTIDTKYKQARIYLHCLRAYHWIKISDIPHDIRYEVIDLIDKGFSSDKKIEINECFDRFRILIF